MKPLIISFIFCLIAGVSYSQSTYFPMIETGKTWHVVEGAFGANWLTYTYKTEGDTLIGQNNFQILYRSNEEFPVNWDKTGYIREEEKKVYYSPFSVNDTVFQEPGMVYDFGVELYDTLTITSFAYNIPYELEIVIAEIDSVLIDNEYRRKIFYACDEWTYENNFFIEGIGSNNGLIEPGFYCYIVCPTIDLLCVKEGNNVIYHNEFYEECYIVGIEENAIVQQMFTVYPNPTKGNIYILPHTDVNSNIVVKIYNLQGVVVLEEIILNYNLSKINVKNLKEGLYLFRILNKDQMLQNGKFLKQN